MAALRGGLYAALMILGCMAGASLLSHIVYGIACNQSGRASVTLSHDMFAWNRARFEFGGRALDSGIAVNDIEGGFSWNGYYAPRGGSYNYDLSRRGLVLPFNRQFFPDLTGRYARSFSPISGTVVVDQEPYRLWLPPAMHNFLLLRDALP